MKVTNLAQYPKNLAQINKELQKVYPLVYLVKGDGYFYLVSDDELTATKLGYLQTTSIYVNSLGQQPLGRWVNDCVNVAKQADDDFEEETEIEKIFTQSLEVSE